VDVSGLELTSLKELTTKVQLDPQQNPATGFWSIPGGHLPHAGILAEITGIGYSVPFQTTTHQITVEPNGRAKLILKSEDGQLDKILTDTDLRRVVLDKPTGTSSSAASKQ
jgi:hypothetical protein